MRYKSNDEAMIEQLQKDPELTHELLKIAIEENTPEELATVIRQIRAAGYTVSVAPKPNPSPRKQTKPGTTKKVTRHPLSRGQARRSAAIA